jgi:Asp-tRNA(Asn)/Glu-tRNA(Gln) amidotransferase A subunit family amidase
MDRVDANSRHLDEELCFLSAAELGAAYRARTLTPSEVTEAVLRQIERVNPHVNAFVTITAELAQAAAREADHRFAEGRVAGPLDGVPVGIKDLSPTAGIRTTRGSRVYEWEVPTEDAPIVERPSVAGRSFSGRPTRRSSAGSHRPTTHSSDRRATPTTLS